MLTAPCRVALLLVGQLRYINPDRGDRWREAFAGDCDVDIFIHGWYTDGNVVANATPVWHSAAPPEMRTEALNKLKRGYRPRAILVEDPMSDEELWPNHRQITPWNNRLRYDRLEYNTLSYYNSMKRAQILLEDYDDGNYTWVVRSRIDAEPRRMLWLAELNRSLVYVNDWHPPRRRTKERRHWAANDIVIMNVSVAKRINRIVDAVFDMSPPVEFIDEALFYETLRRAGLLTHQVCMVSRFTTPRRRVSQLLDVQLVRHIDLFDSPVKHTSASRVHCRFDTTPDVIPKRLFYEVPPFVATLHPSTPMDPPNNITIVCPLCVLIRSPWNCSIPPSS